MAGNYCTYEQVEKQLFNADAAEKGQVEAYLASASRMIDRMVEVDDGHFDVAADAASERTLYGSGTEYLRLPPFVGTITANDVAYDDTGLTAPAFTVRGGKFLVAAIGYCWKADEPITVSARWGFAAIPDEINQACIELVIAMWRTSDVARERVVSDNGDEQFRVAKIPLRTKEVCERWRKLQPVFFA